MSAPRYRLAILLSAALGVAFLAPKAHADDSFGFGDDLSTSSGEAAASPLPVSLSGELSAGAIGFMDELSGTDSRRRANLGDAFSGAVNLTVQGARADGFLNLDVHQAGEGASPFGIDEAYVRAYFGKLDVEAGLRKLAWGRADSQGPLDVINPQDQSDLTVTDELERKIARPIVRLSYALGNASRVEGVFMPSFEGDGFSEAGRWAPSQLRALESTLGALALAYAVPPTGVSIVRPDTSAISWSQGGIRLSTTAGSADLGAQYFYGYGKRPAYAFTLVPGSSLSVEARYNPYHQVGLDCASVVAGINLRAELGANVTEDLSGDDPATQNPSAVWSVGFDRALGSLMTINLQYAGSYRFMDDKVGSKPFDSEASTRAMKSKVTAIASRKFLRDALELKATALVGVEDADWYLIPAAVWTKDDLELELKAGFFGGSVDGEMGQFRDNDYLSCSVTLMF